MVENNKTEKAIFETYDRFPKKVFIGDKMVLNFNRQNLNLTRDQGGSLIRLKQSDSWICVLIDPVLINLARTDKRCGKKGDGKAQTKFWEIERIPTKLNKTSNVVTGGMTSQGSSDVDFEAWKKKAIRYGELKNKIVLTDGVNYSSKALPEQIEEFENLKKELGDT